MNPSIAALRTLKNEAKALYEQEKMTLDKFEGILKQAYEHCKAFPSALASFFEYAPPEWVARIQVPK